MTSGRRPDSPRGRRFDPCLGALACPAGGTPRPGPVLQRRHQPAPADARKLVRFPRMSEFRMGQAAELLGVSPDTVRRLADSGELETTRTAGGHRVVEGRTLAR